MGDPEHFVPDVWAPGRAADRYTVARCFHAGVIQILGKCLGFRAEIQFSLLVLQRFPS